MNLLKTSSRLFWLDCLSKLGAKQGHNVINDTIFLTYDNLIGDFPVIRPRFVAIVMKTWVSYMTKLLAS